MNIEVGQIYFLGGLSEAYAVMVDKLPNDQGLVYDLVVMTPDRSSIDYIQRSYTYQASEKSFLRGGLMRPRLVTKRKTIQFVRMALI